MTKNQNMSKDKKGQMFNEGNFELEVTIEQLRMLSGQIVPKLPISGIVVLKSGTRARLKINLTHAFSPEQMDVRSTTIMGDTNLNAEAVKGIVRLEDFIWKFFDKKRWFLIGSIIQGQVEIPVIISHYEQFNLSFYVIKQQNEDIDSFLPQFSNN